MTGFVSKDFKIHGTNFHLEIKTINGRYLDIKSKIPYEYLLWETELAGLIKKILNRGRVDIFVSANPDFKNQATINAQIGQFKNQFAIIKHLKKQLGIRGDIDLSLLSQFADVIDIPRERQKIKKHFPIFKKHFAESIKKLSNMRAKEGATLELDIKKRIFLINTLLDKIAKEKKTIIKALRAKYVDRLKALQEDVKIDENRFNQELVFHIDKMDFTEEVIRLKSHIGEFKSNLQKKGPIGRKLDFLIQEMGRETNTLSVKSNSPQISRMAVDIKTELEKIREQLQNVE